MRLYRNSVAGSEVLEVERRHDAHHRCGRRLVPADLDTVTGLAHLVRMMDHADGQPEDSPLQLLEDL